jgi:hypothetical protein
MVHADDVNLLGESIRITKKKEVLSVVSKETGPEENAVKTKCMFISHKQNAGQYHTITTGLKSFEIYKIFENYPNISKFHSCRN